MFSAVHSVPMTVTMDTERRDRGFSLVELLVVIVVLGILATVVVFAVRGIADRGEVSACDSDQRTVINAMEARLADRGAYASEATLKSEGFLRDESSLHDVTLSGTDYEIVAVGSCVGVASSTTVAGPSSSTLPPPPAPTLFPTAQIGTGPASLLMLTYSMPPSTLAMLESLCSTDLYVTCTIVYTGTSVVKVDELIANLAAHPSDLYWDHTPDGPITIFQQDGVTATTGPVSTLHEFLVAAYGSQVASPPPPGGPSNV